MMPPPPRKDLARSPYSLLQSGYDCYGQQLAAVAYGTQQHP